MIIVTGPYNESTREIIKVTRDVTEATPLSYLARARIELVPRPGWTKHLVSRPIRSLVLPTPQRQKKSLIVDVVDPENDKVPRECLSKASAEQVTQAPPQQQPQQHSASAGTEVVNEPPAPVQQRTEKQAVDEPGEKSQKPVPASKPSADVETVQQRTVEQVIDVSREKHREDSAPQQSNAEPVIDRARNLLRGNALQSKVSTCLTTRVLQPQYHNLPRRLAWMEDHSTSREELEQKQLRMREASQEQCRLEFERVRFEKAAGRLYLRARARSPHRADRVGCIWNCGRNRF